MERKTRRHFDIGRWKGVIVVGGEAAWKEKKKLWMWISWLSDESDDSDGSRNRKRCNRNRGRPYKIRSNYHLIHLRGGGGGYMQMKTVSQEFDEINRSTI